MSQLANAGHVQALPDGGVVFAPFVRDEVVRFGPDGVERWRLVRGFEHATPDPSVQVGGTGGRPALEVDYAPVNLGLAVGPDGMLYVLSTDGPTDRRTDGRSAGAAITASSRLYSVDPERGTVLRTRRFDTALPTIAVDAEGRVRTPDPARILPGSDPGRRARLEPFDLPAISGGRVSFAGIAGKVTLVNFWASWCGPCAEELPALDSLAGAVDTARTRFVALSDDVSDDAARRFVAERDFRNLRFALGSGALRRRYRYFGLPYTVLLDGRGGIIHRWSGYGGPAQIEEIARLIRAELARGPSDLHQH
jgi:thiol-disulfide isomerase/thioredoxin